MPSTPSDLDDSESLHSLDEPQQSAGHHLQSLFTATKTVLRDRAARTTTFGFLFLINILLLSVCVLHLLFALRVAQLTTNTMQQLRPGPLPSRLLLRNGPRPSQSTVPLPLAFIRNLSLPPARPTHRQRPLCRLPRRPNPPRCSRGLLARIEPAQREHGGAPPCGTRDGTSVL